MSISDTLKQLTALREKATPGEWYHEDRSEVLAPIPDSFDGDRLIVANTLTVTRRSIAELEANTKLIVAAVNALPAIQEMLSKLEGAIDAMDQESARLDGERRPHERDCIDWCVDKVREALGGGGT